MEFLRIQLPSHPAISSAGPAAQGEVLAIFVAAILIAAIWALYIEWRDSHDGGARRLVLETQLWLRHHQRF